MAETARELLLKPAPFLKATITTPRLMLDVGLGLLPATAAAIYYFGLSAVLVLMATTLTAVATERLFSRRPTSISDGSAVLTGLLFGLTLPPPVPLWIAAVGSIAGIGLGKLVWGGLGNNLFNPALVGRAFVQAAFPGALTTWVAPGRPFTELAPSTLALPFMRQSVDVVSMATPLAEMKFEHAMAPTMSLLGGDVAGSLGETSALAIAVGGAYLILRRTCDWRVPVAVGLSVMVFSAILRLSDSDRFATPWFMLLSGGLLFGAVFMATDPVTSPTVPRGAWLFGLGIGILVVLIRVFGGLPEGVMYAILLMNAATPLIERFTQPRPFGRKLGS